MMSNERKPSSRSNTPGRNPGNQSANSAVPAVPETTGNSLDFEISGLTFRQQSALPIVAVSRTLAQAARDSGVSEKTLRKWLHDPAFRSELEHIREESWRLARKQLQAALPRCLAMLAEMAAEAEDPAIRLRAIRTLLTYGVKFGELDSLADELRDLRAALLDGK